MRIISGRLKGRKINGKIPPNIRPTQDAMRETMFNIMQNHFDFDGKVVCDLCSGTGALAFEALSRGAEFIYLVDISRHSLSFAKAVADEFKLSPDEYQIIQSKSELFFKKFNYDRKVDVIFADPPYSANIINQLLLAASDSENFSTGGYFIAEFGASTNLIVPDNFKILSERNFAISRFAILRKTETLD